MTTHLLTDRSPLLYPRRRADCARLDACERAWIAAHGGVQAKCPKRCLAFLPRQEGAPRATSSDMEPHPKHQQPAAPAPERAPEPNPREQPTKRDWGSQPDIVSEPTEKPPKPPP